MDFPVSNMSMVYIYLLLQEILIVEWFDIFPPPFLSTFSIMEVFYPKCLLMIGFVWLIFIILAPKTQPEILTLSSYSLLEICET